MPRVGSHGLPRPGPVRSHCPFQSGYLAASNSCARAPALTSGVIGRLQHCKRMWASMGPAIARALAAGGVLIYEPFARGNQRFGAPAQPRFPAAPRRTARRLCDANGVTFEQGEISVPRPAAIQRIAVVVGPVRRLPDPVGLDMGQSQE